jgi:hypothetical protein
MMKKKSKRKTNSNYPNQSNHNYGYGYNYTNKNNTYNSTKNQTLSFKECPGAYLLLWFIIFFIIGLYLICEMKKFEQTKNRIGDVWFYLYLSNLGILEAAGVNFLNLNNVAVDSSPFG